MIAALALAAAALAGCPVEEARYVLRHRPAVTIAFRAVDTGSDWPSGVALAVHDARSARTSWWLPSIGGTNGLEYVVSTTDVTAPGYRPPSLDGGPRPEGSRTIVMTDARYDIVDDVPRRGQAAPAHLLFPNSAGSTDLTFHDKQFFDLAGCTHAQAG